MTKPHLSMHYDQNAVMMFHDKTSFGRFLSGESLRLQDIDPEDWEVINLVEGPCLAVELDVFNITPIIVSQSMGRSQSEFDPDCGDYVRNLMDHLYPAEFRSGVLTRSGGRSLGSLLSDAPPAGVPARSIHVDCLDAVTCRRPGASADMVPCAEAYRELYSKSTWWGLLNRAPCHIDCGADFLWIDEGVCRLWLRGGSYAEWVRLFPFRVTREGDGVRD